MSMCHRNAILLFLCLKFNIVSKSTNKWQMTDLAKRNFQFVFRRNGAEENKTFLLFEIFEKSILCEEHSASQPVRQWCDEFIKEIWLALPRMIWAEIVWEKGKEKRVKNQAKNERKKNERKERKGKRSKQNARIINDDKLSWNWKIGFYVVGAFPSKVPFWHFRISTQLSRQINQCWLIIRAWTWKVVEFYLRKMAIFLVASTSILANPDRQILNIDE